QPAKPVEAIHLALRDEFGRRPAAEHRISIRQLDPAVGERGVGIEDVQGLVDAEHERNAGQEVERQRADVAGLVLVEGRGRRRAEDGDLLLAAEPPLLRDIEEGTHRRPRHALAHLGFRALLGTHRRDVERFAFRQGHWAVHPYVDTILHIWISSKRRRRSAGGHCGHRQTPPFLDRRTPTPHKPAARGSRGPRAWLYVPLKAAKPLKTNDKPTDKKPARTARFECRDRTRRDEKCSQSSKRAASSTASPRTM